MGNKVLLSSCTFSSDVAAGAIIVAKMDGDSTVTVRYTTDDWDTYADAVVRYSTSENESQDRYTFEIDMEKKTSLHFAICLHARNTEFWDNNNTKQLLLGHRVATVVAPDTVTSSHIAYIL